MNTPADGKNRRTRRNLTKSTRDVSVFLVARVRKTRGSSRVKFKFSYDAAVHVLQRWKNEQNCKGKNTKITGKKNPKCTKETSAFNYNILSLFFNPLETELKSLKTPQDKAETSAGVRARNSCGWPRGPPRRSGTSREPHQCPQTGPLLQGLSHVTRPSLTSALPTAHRASPIFPITWCSPLPLPGPAHRLC